MSEGSHPPEGISVFFMSTMNTSFIRDDIELLRRHFTVDLRIGAGMRAPLDILRRAARADVSLAWFGSVYSCFMVLGARLGGRRSIIVLGGVDTARDATLGYGIWLSRWKGMLLRWGLRHADRVLAVDASLIDELRRSSGWDAGTVETLPTGYDADRWRPGSAKEDLILTVGICDTLPRARVKGLDLFLAAAARLPERRFRAVGVTAELARELAAITPPNVEIIPPVAREELERHYAAARLYCQVSRREGLPNALCEAMLSGCIPIGTAVGGIPAAIGTTGFVVEKENVEAICASIEQGMALPPEAGLAARARIATLFSRERRERELVAIIKQLAA